jgi:hypothetical protein
MNPTHQSALVLIGLDQYHRKAAGLAGYGAYGPGAAQNMVAAGADKLVQPGLVNTLASAGSYGLIPRAAPAPSPWAGGVKPTNMTAANGYRTGPNSNAAKAPTAPSPWAPSTWAGAAQNMVAAGADKLVQPGPVNRLASYASGGILPRATPAPAPSPWVGGVKPTNMTAANGYRTGPNPNAAKARTGTTPGAAAIPGAAGAGPGYKAPTAPAPGTGFIPGAAGAGPGYKAPTAPALKTSAAPAPKTASASDIAFLSLVKAADLRLPIVTDYNKLMSSGTLGSDPMMSPGRLAKGLGVGAGAGASIGGLGGAILADEDDKEGGAARGAIRGAGAGLGVAGGSALGMMLAAALSKKTNHPFLGQDLAHYSMSPGAMSAMGFGGAALGGTLGYLGGAKLSPKKDKKKDKDEEKKANALTTAVGAVARPAARFVETEVMGAAKPGIGAGLRNWWKGLHPNAKGVVGTAAGVGLGGGSLALAHGQGKSTGQAQGYDRGLTEAFQAYKNNTSGFKGHLRQMGAGLGIVPEERLFGLS